MSGLTTHVLDATRGAPAAGIRVELRRCDGGELADPEGRTDADGRARVGPAALEPGSYTLTFHTGEYFAGRGSDTFYPQVDVVFSVPEPPADHYHVPLLLSPFAYSTYRGS